MNIFLKREYGKNRLTVKQILSDWKLCLAFGFGSGLSRYMPGTIGTLAAIPIYLLLVQTNFWLYSLFIIAALIGGIEVCRYTAEKLAVHDFGGIVWDEVVGLLVTLWFVPFSWSALIAGFILFRIFDISKPWPIKWVDRKVEGGVGIMLDDILAGLFAGVILTVLIRLKYC